MILKDMWNDFTDYEKKRIIICKAESRDVLLCCACRGGYPADILIYNKITKYLNNEDRQRRSN